MPIKMDVSLSRRKALAAVAGGGIWLSGCVGGATSPDALYGLSAPEGQTGSGKHRSRRQILVTRPRALKALSNNMIAVVDRGPVYSYFPKAAWADDLPVVVQSAIADTLESTGRLGGVGFPGDGLLIDYQLQTELRSFELRIDGANRALVELSARLINDRNGRVVGSRSFGAQVATSGADASHAVAALNAASQQVFSELSGWVLSLVR